MWSVVFLLLSQAPNPPAAVLVASKRPGADAPAKAVAARVTEAVTAAGFSAQSDAPLKKAKLNPRDCQGAAACLQKVAAALGPGVVVFGVDVGKIGDSLAIHLEAVTATEALGALDVPVDGALKTADLSALDTFAKSIAAKRAPAPATPPVAETDAPKATPIAPAPTPEPAPAVVVRPAPAPQRSGIRRVVPWIAGAGALASLGVGGAFFAMGSGEKSKFDASVVGGVSRLPGSELQALSSRGNLDFTLGFALAGVGVGLAALAAMLFAL